MKVFIIDDEPKIRRGLSHIVNHIHPEWPIPRTAGDTASALSQADFWDSDLLFLDIRLPGMDGLSFLKMIREKTGDRIQVVIISGFAEFSFAQRAAELGVKGYLLKPIAISKVEEVLSHAETEWKKRQQEKELHSDIVKNLHRVQLNFLSEAMTGGETLDRVSFEKEYARLRLPDKPFFLVRRAYEQPADDPKARSDEFRSWLAEKLHGTANILLLRFLTCVVAVVFEDRREERWHEVLKVRYTAPFSISLSSEYEHPYSIRQAYEEVSAQPFLPEHTKPAAGDETAYIDSILEQQNSYHAAVQKTIRYVRESYMHPVSLDSAAEKVSLSPNYLSDLFKKETGANFSAFLNDYRLCMAKKLLRGGSAKITTIAVNVGFNDNHYFSHLFSRRVGMTPKTYRLSAISASSDRPEAEKGEKNA